MLVYSHYFSFCVNVIFLHKAKQGSNFTTLIKVLFNMDYSYQFLCTYLPTDSPTAPIHLVPCKGFGWIWLCFPWKMIWFGINWLILSKGHWFGSGWLTLSRPTTKNFYSQFLLFGQPFSVLHLLWQGQLTVV